MYIRLRSQLPREAWLKLPAALRPVRSSSPMDRTNSKPIATSSPTSRLPARTQPRLRRPVPIPPMLVAEKAIAAVDPELRAIKLLEPVHNESVTPVHSAAGCHFVADDRRASHWHRSVPAASSFSTAGSGLSNHSGDDVLSRS